MEDAVRIIGPRGGALEKSMTAQVGTKKPAGCGWWRAVLTMFFVALGAAESSSETISTARPGAVGGATNASLQAALEKLKFPG